MSNNNVKKIVVTGAGGFLGRNLVEALKVKEEYFVAALSSRGEELQEMNTSYNVRYYHKDAIFSDKGEGILNGAMVVNCAFPRNSRGIEMADGLQYIQRLFDRAKECRVKAIINISSQSVYCQTREETATEETPVCIESPYAVGKYMTELMLESICKGTVIAYTNLRMASLIGPGFDQRIVNRLVKQAVAGEQLCVIQNDQRFGFFDVEDAVRAVIAVLNTDYCVWNGVYTVGNAQNYSIEEIAHCIETLFARKHIEFPGIKIEVRQGKSNSTVGYQLMNMDTGFKPEIDITCSILKILNKEMDKEIAI